MMSEKNEGFVFPLEVLSCPWSELIEYCNAGTVFLVEPSIDIKELAHAVAQDNASFVQKVMLEKKMWNAQGQEYSSQTQCSFIIVQPYIFVEVPA